MTNKISKPGLLFGEVLDKILLFGAFLRAPLCQIMLGRMSVSFTDSR